jgi:translation initiation factor 2B subunit (eIF-2B alpha/beta/delta family)
MMLGNGYNIHECRRRTVAELKDYDVLCELITDASVGHVIESVDMVLVGAEGVTENGGIINQVTHSFYSSIRWERMALP